MKDKKSKIPYLDILGEAAKPLVALLKEIWGRFETIEKAASGQAQRTTTITSQFEERLANVETLTSGHIKDIHALYVAAGFVPGHGRSIKEMEIEIAVVQRHVHRYHSGSGNRKEATGPPQEPRPATRSTEVIR